MALNSLAGLRTAALGHRTDLLTRFPDFLELAEQRMYYGGDDVPPLRSRHMEQSATLSFTSGVANLPTDYLDKRALYWPGAAIVDALSYEPPQSFYGQSRDRQGVPYPIAYTIEGLTAYVEPAQTGNARLLYYRTLPAMSADGDNNAILLNHPSIYIHGIEVERYRYLRDDAEMAKALRSYASAVIAANAQTVQARVGGSMLRKRPVSIA